MKLKGDVRLVVVVVGYGDEHDKAVNAFEKDAEGNPNIVLLSLSGEQDPEVVGDALAKLIGLDEDDNDLSRGLRHSSARALPTAYTLSCE